jgi:hypothetical protein
MPLANGAPRHLTLFSRQQALVTLHASELGGPRARQRLIYRGGPLPTWLEAYAPFLGPGQTLVAVAMGRVRLGSTTKIRSIITYPAVAGRPASAYIYVEETECGSRAERSAAPVHIVRCEALPQQVQFVEVSD